MTTTNNTTSIPLNVEPTHPVKRRVKRSTVDGSGFERAMVSFRGDTAVMMELREIGVRKGIPYQALLRTALKEFVMKNKSSSSTPA